MALRRLTQSCRVYPNQRPYYSLDRHLDVARVNNVLLLGYSRHGSTHKSPKMFPNIDCSKSAHKFVTRLDEKERALLLEELNRLDQKPCPVEEIGDPEKATVTIPHLKNVFYYNGLPFIGFGFLDNFVMIVAGEYIDVTLGVTLGISTMAAAAFGNLISDIAGLGTAGYMESLVGRFGITHPELTIAQASLWQTRFVSLAGRVLGITVGCIIGMFPLLFFRDDKQSDETTNNQQSTQTESSNTPTDTSTSAAKTDSLNNQAVQATSAQKPDEIMKGSGSAK